MNRHPKTCLGRAASEEIPISAAIREAAANWVARRDAGLSAHDESEYTAWLEADAGHRAAVDRLDFTWKALDRPLTTGTADAVLCELEHRARLRRRRRIALAAAAAVLLLGAGVGWRTMQREPELKTAQVTSAAVLLPKLQALPDGSIAELRDGAEIAVEFNPEQRRIVLRGGQAYFKVAKNPKRPFVVVAGGVEVRAVGTAFSVDLGRREVEVLVTEGNVAVDVVADASISPGLPGHRRILIGAGDGAIVRISPPGGKSQVDALADVDLQARLAWRSPRLEFSGTPLIEAVALMNRHNRVQFVIEDPVLARMRVSGIFGATNTDAFVRLLEASFDIQPDRQDSGEIVLRRKR